MYRRIKRDPGAQIEVLHSCTLAPPDSAQKTAFHDRFGVLDILAVQEFERNNGRVLKAGQVRSTPTFQPHVQDHGADLPALA